MKRKQYSIHGSYRLNQNLTVLRRKHEKPNNKILGEFVNSLTEMLARYNESDYFVSRDGDKLVFQVFNKKCFKGTD